MAVVSVYEGATGTIGWSVAGGVTITDELLCCPAAIGRSSNLEVNADIDACNARTTSTSGSISGLVSSLTHSVGGRQFRAYVVSVVVKSVDGIFRCRALVASRLQSAATPQRVAGPGVVREVVVVARVAGGAGGDIARDDGDVE